VTRVEVTRHSRIDPWDYEHGLAVGELDMRGHIKVHWEIRSSADLESGGALSVQSIGLPNTVKDVSL
jgi:hypothetical protein